MEEFVKWGAGFSPAIEPFSNIYSKIHLESFLEFGLYIQSLRLLQIWLHMLLVDSHRAEQPKKVQLQPKRLNNDIFE